MSCNRQHVAAAVCGFIESTTGEKVSQADWHALVAAAKEDGYKTGRTRLDIHDTISSLRSLGKSAGDEAAAEAALAEIGYTDEGRAGMSIDAVDGKFPTYTQNMAAVVQYLTNEGVRESLDKVRAGRKSINSSPISDQEIQDRMSTGTSRLGDDFKPYTFNVTGPDIVASDVVYARSAKEAKATVNEWAVRFRGQSDFTTSVRKADPDSDMAEWTGGPLPRLAQDMTEGQVEDVVVWLTKQPMADLRQRRDIHEEQWLLALKKGMDDVAESEAKKTDMATDALWRQDYGVPLMGRHNTQTQWEARYGDS